MKSIKTVGSEYYNVFNSYLNDRAESHLWSRLYYNFDHVSIGRWPALNIVYISPSQDLGRYYQRRKYENLRKVNLLLNDCIIGEGQLKPHPKFTLSRPSDNGYLMGYNILVNVLKENFPQIKVIENNSKV